MAEWNRGIRLERVTQLASLFLYESLGWFDQGSLSQEAPPVPLPEPAIKFDNVQDEDYGDTAEKTVRNLALNLLTRTITQSFDLHPLTSQRESSLL